MTERRYRLRRHLALLTYAASDLLFEVASRVSPLESAPRVWVPLEQPRRPLELVTSRLPIPPSRRPA